MYFSSLDCWRCISWLFKLLFLLFWTCRRFYNETVSLADEETAVLALFQFWCLWFVLLLFKLDFFARRINVVFNLCLSDLLPLNYECSAKYFNEDHGRFQREALGSVPDMKCERVDPAKKRMLKEKFEIAESYLGRFIGNILKHFTDERKVQGVRRLTLTSLPTPLDLSVAWTCTLSWVENLFARFTTATNCAVLLDTLWAWRLTLSSFSFVLKFLRW